LNAELHFFHVKYLFFRPFGSAAQGGRITRPPLATSLPHGMHNNKFIFILFAIYFSTATSPFSASFKRSK
jgi:hypothetical protein